jgi:hypothetical protein
VTSHGPKTHCSSRRGSSAVRALADDRLVASPGADASPPNDDGVCARRDRSVQPEACSGAHQQAARSDSGERRSGLSASPPARDVAGAAARSPSARGQPRLRTHSRSPGRSKRVAVIASRGCGGCIAPVGAARAFEESGILPAAVSCCSGPVIWGAMRPAGLTAQEMVDFWLSWRPEDYLDIQWSRCRTSCCPGFGTYRTRRGRCDPARVRSADVDAASGRAPDTALDDRLQHGPR